MKKFLILFFCNLTLFSQEIKAPDYLQKADSLYRNATYQEAAIYYNKVSKNAFKNKKHQKYIYAELQKIKIKTVLKNYNIALKEIDKLKKYIIKSKTSNDSLWVSLIDLNSIILKHIGKFKESLLLNNSLLQSKKNYKKYIQEILHTRSRIEIDLGKYDDAIISARKTIPIYKTLNDSLNIAAIYNIIGVSYYFKQNLDSTLYYYLKSLNIKKSIKKDYAQLAISCFNIGIVYEDIAHYDKAINYYNKAIYFNLKDGNESIGFLIDIYGALVNIYNNLQDFENADKYANKLISLVNDTNEDQYPFLSFSYISYAGLKAMKKEYKTAIEYVNKSLKIRRNTYGENHKWTLENWQKLGELYLELKNFKKAKINFNQALKIANKLNDKEKIVEVNKGFGLYYLAIKDYKNAEKSFTKAINNINNTFFETEELRYELNYLQLKTSYLKRDYATAKLIIKKLKNKFTKNVSIYLLYVNVLDIENKLLKNNSSSQEKIIKNCDLILEYLSKIKNQYTTRNSIVHVSNNFDNIIDNAVNLCFNIYQKTNNEIFKIKALEFSEFNRNSTLLTGLKNMEIKKKTNIPKEILDSENKIINNIARVKQEIFYLKEDKKTNFKELSLLTSKHIKLSSRLDSLQFFLKEKYPNYFQLKNISNKFYLKDIQNRISLDEVVLEYYFSDSNLYVFYIKKTSLELFKIENMSEIKNHILNYRQALKERKNTSKYAKSIYKTIFPKKIIVSKIIIITDDLLNFLPFESLITKKDYFLKTKSIYYSGSLQLMVYQKGIKLNKKLKFSWLGFAPNYKKITNLKYTLAEINAIQKITNGTSFLKKNATKEAFLKNINTASILHLATHTKLNNSNSLYNKILFSDSDTNNVLTASEIYNLNINSNLVVLSSCNTGYGIINKGEGVQNMSRAFTYAGVPSTIMSLWKVPDKETNLIMQLFYKHLHNGESKSLALKNAKLDYLKNTNDITLKEPFYWAGFVLYGNDNAIYKRQNFTKYFLITFILLILFVFLKKKLF